MRLSHDKELQYPKFRCAGVFQVGCMPEPGWYSFGLEVVGTEIWTLSIIYVDLCWARKEMDEMAQTNHKSFRCCLMMRLWLVEENSPSNLLMSRF